ncbi:MAG: response regulator [Planctomycetes bacterium]|nr:response regulator [Planctomycetota bacterium]
MRLEELTLGVLTKAVENYLELAYGGGTKPRWIPDLDLPPDAPPRELLKLFQADHEEGELARYTMRLGNRNYPFMKLVFQEHIVDGQFQFGVDTHDDMEIKPDYPDYEAWMAVRRFNRELKVKIEQRLEEIGVPTAAQLRREVAERCASSTQEEAKDRKILVVDDEEDLAETVETLLEARGYSIQKAHDGRKGLEMALEHRPDMILLDYELPEMDGLEVIAALRANVVTRDIPVLLCTASKISMQEIHAADGFLAKPYNEGLLYKMVNHVMEARESSS